MIRIIFHIKNRFKPGATYEEATAGLARCNVIIAELDEAKIAHDCSPKYIGDDPTVWYAIFPDNEIAEAAVFKLQYGVDASELPEELIAGRFQ
jgi:hypothetical protein